jgi:hypothetical protein
LVEVIPSQFDREREVGADVLRWYIYDHDDMLGWCEPCLRLSARQSKARADRVDLLGSVDPGIVRDEDKYASVLEDAHALAG